MKKENRIKLEFNDNPATNQGRPKIEQMTMMIAKTRRSKW